MELPAAPLTVTAAQARVTALDIPANVATAATLVRRAADRGTDLVVLPELFLTGYELPGITADPASRALGPDDPRLDPLAAVCADTRTAVVVGAPVLAPPAQARPGQARPGQDAGRGELYISALVLDRTGGLAARYDKQHVTPGERAAGFASGPGGCTVTLDGWRLGLGICWDSGFPEHARAAALDGCHGYLVGAMFGEGPGAHQRATVFPARALDNTCYVVLANHNSPSGPYRGCGGSAVWGPDGHLLADAETADPGLATASFDPAVLASVRAGEPVLADPSLTAPVGPRREAALDRPRLSVAPSTLGRP